MKPTNSKRPGPNRGKRIHVPKEKDPKSATAVMSSSRIKQPAKQQGREYVPTPADRRTVEGMIFAGIPEDDICKCLGEDGISTVTLQKHFRGELRTWYQKSINKIARNLAEIAASRDELRPCPVCKQTGKAMVVVDDPLTGLPVEKVQSCWLCHGKLLNKISADLKAAVTASIFILKCRGRWRENPQFDDNVAELVKRVVGVSEKEIGGR